MKIDSTSIVYWNRHEVNNYVVSYIPKLPCVSLHAKVTSATDKKIGFFSGVPESVIPIFAIGLLNWILSEIKSQKLHAYNDVFHSLQNLHLMNAFHAYLGLTRTIFYYDTKNDFRIITNNIFVYVSMTIPIR